MCLYTNDFFVRYPTLCIATYGLWQATELMTIRSANIFNVQLIAKSFLSWLKHHIQREVVASTFVPKRDVTITLLSCNRVEKCRHYLAITSNCFVFFILNKFNAITDLRFSTILKMCL